MSMRAAIQPRAKKIAGIGSSHQDVDGHEFALLGPCRQTRFVGRRRRAG
ncbi:MAG: hypothetical protein IPG28_20590 [Betaproteobacteria bacterium]|nr:hypothetical protein [Betaproteobacteria bacterium]